MKNIFILVLLGLVMMAQSCISIPKIQEGGFVSAINVANVQLKDGQNLKMAKKRKAEKTTIVLVRHAEKMKDSSDPLLTDEGKERAENLSKILSTMEVDQIYSTDYKRTQLTATPTAKSKDLTIQSYNPRKLKDFGNMLLQKHQGETILVVGHSNTTPQLLNSLMDKKLVKSIDESDYENLFIINVFEGEEKKALLLKF